MNNNCVTNKCKVLDYKDECRVHYETKRRHISNKCPCIKCLIRPACNKMCQARMKYAYELLKLKLGYFDEKDIWFYEETYSVTPGRASYDR